MQEVLGALGVIQGNPQQTRLITPYADGLKVFSTFLDSAKSKWRTIIYGDTHPVFFDKAIAFFKAGHDILIIFDHTQSCGPAEKAQIQRLVDAGMVEGKHFIIGTSPEAHQIIHLKSTWLDDRYVEDGSLNYSPSGLKQVNSVSIMDWPEYANYLNGIFQELWKWILEHEPQYQLKVGS